MEVSNGKIVCQQDDEEIHLTDIRLEIYWCWRHLVLDTSAFHKKKTKHDMLLKQAYLYAEDTRY